MTLNMTNKKLQLRPLLHLVVLPLALVCAASAVKAQLRYAGSDTVEPVIEAAHVAYLRGHAGYKMQMQALGTSSGLRELCTGRAALVGASRPIKTEEVKTCAAAGVQYAEIPVALDAVVLAVSTKNTWLKELTLAEARTLFDPQSSNKLLSWKQVRASFPDVPIRTAGPDIKHGTFGFFTENLGLKGFIRSDFKDFTTHAATGRFVAGDVGAIGFMPMGDANAMDGQVRVLALDMGAGPITPSQDEVMSGRYDKLSRTVYLYINSALLAKGNAQDIEFAQLLIKDMEKFVRFANLIPLRGLQYQENFKRLSLSR
ncbi:MAG: substrate-binding domain-containing protein [Rubrivivax sp.]|nr:substrate-binding domain-containing protein [Rubrivivax sp.]